MRVRILIGKQTGQIQVVAQPEGEHMIATGYGELVAAEELPAGASLADPDEGNDVSRDEAAPGTSTARVRTPRKSAAAPKATSRRKRR